MPGSISCESTQYFFHFLSKLKNFIVNLTISLLFLKVTGSALSACWKIIRAKKTQQQTEGSWVMDREAPLEPSTKESRGCGWKHQAEMLEAWMGVGGNGGISRGQWSLI